MRKVVTVLCFLALASCAPSKNNSGGVTATEQSKSNGIETCQALGAKSTNLADTSSVVPTSTTVDPNFGQYIVKYKEATGFRPSGQPLREFNVSAMKLTSISGDLYSLQIKGSAEEKTKILAQLAAESDVEYVEPDYPIDPIPQTPTAVITDDPYFSKQWFHSTLNSLAAWQVDDGSDEIIAAVVDTGVDYTHPDLVDNMWINKGEIPYNGKDDDGNGYIDDVYGWNFAANNNDPRSSAKAPHGSHVAGLIGARGNNHLGVVGVAPKVKLMALKFMDDSGAGVTSNAVRAIDYAIQKKVFLINNSWGSNRFSRTLSDAISRAAKAGILFFAAAGNGNKGVGYNIDATPWYPASYNQWNVFSVAATTIADRLTDFSNFSKNKVDVAAPGYGIYSTVSGTNYQMMSGTSMATPIVAGLAVLVKAANPYLDPAQILNVIRESSDKIPALQNKVRAGGRVDSYNAVMLARASKNCGLQ